MSDAIRIVTCRFSRKPHIEDDECQDVTGPQGTQDRIDHALYAALTLGAVDGAHHKQWALDQVVRILTGDRYDEVIAEHRRGEDGPHTYDWDEGIAP